MKILKNKTYQSLVGKMVKYRELCRVGQDVLIETLKIIPEEVEKTRQEMILNFQEQLK